MRCVGKRLRENKKKTKKKGEEGKEKRPKSQLRHCYVASCSRNGREWTDTTVPIPRGSWLPYPATSLNEITESDVSEKRANTRAPGVIVFGMFYILPFILVSLGSHAKEDARGSAAEYNACLLSRSRRKN